MTAADRPAPWQGGWRVAIRLARRDILAHRGRSAIVVVMILLPVAIMVGGMTLLSTSRVDATERPEATLGSAPAVLAYSGPFAMRQSPDATSKMFCDGGSGESGGQLTPVLWEAEAVVAKERSDEHCRRSLPVPGIDPAVGAPSPEAAVGPLSTLVGAPVVPYVRDTAPLGTNFGYGSVQMLRGDASLAVFRGMVDLTSGRWPSAPGEVVVTGMGTSIGLPTNGLIDSEPLRAALGADSVTVVGTAAAPRGPLGIVHLIAPLPPAQGTNAAYYLIDSSHPVPWSEVERLNTYGLVVLSRAVLDAPPHTPMNAVDGWGIHTDESSAALATVGASVLLLAVSCLIAGPAFSVMASRQRRMLALVAANGGSGAQMRRTMLAQALLLGVGAVLCAVVAGVAVVAVIAAVWPERFGPLDIPLGSALSVAVAGLAAAIVSALVPARGLDRLEVAAALAGDVVSEPPRRSRPAVGLALLVLGAVLAVAAIVTPKPLGVLEGDGTAVLLTAGVAACIVGALMLVTSVLSLVGRLAPRLPVAARIALRDATRLPGRATSTVAAVMAGAIVLSAFGIGFAATEELGRRSYVPGAPMGHMVLRPSEVGSFEALRREVEGAVPGVTVREVSALTVPDGLPTEEAGAAQALRTPYVGLLRPGCDLDAPPQVGFAAPCMVTLPGGSPVGVLVADVATARALFGLSGDDEAALRRGEALVFAAAGTSGVCVIDGSGNVTIAAGRVSEPTEPHGLQEWEAPPARHTLRARSIDFAAIQLDGLRALAVIAPETAASLDVEPMAPSYIAGPSETAVEGGGTLTDEQAAQINRVLGTAFPDQVERGFDDSYFGIVRAVLVGLVALLTLVATLTATALAMGEARRDLATLGAAGASPGIRRRVAAWQAGGLAFLGTALGVAVGAVPGVAYSMAISVNSPQSGALAQTGVPDMAMERLRLLAQGTVTVPWDLLLIALVAVPLAAAAIGALLAGGRVDMTRRMD